MELLRPAKIWEIKDSCAGIYIWSISLSKFESSKTLKSVMDPSWSPRSDPLWDDTCKHIPEKLHDESHGAGLSSNRKYPPNVHFFGTPELRKIIPVMFSCSNGRSFAYVFIFLFACFIFLH